MKAGFIGAGKVGFTLGRYLAEKGVCVTGYYSRNSASAQEAANFTKTRYYEDLVSITEDSDTLFITVPDGAIGDVWDDMRNLPIEKKNICHCSGSISSTAFFDAPERGAYRYSVHPLYAISNKYQSYRGIAEAYFAIEGSEAHLGEMKALFAGLGNPVTVIETTSKPLYHAAAVMVSNQIAALIDVGAELLTDCGFARKDAEAALSPLILGNVQAVCQAGPEKALTGPVERCDAATVAGHLDVLPMPAAEIYRLLSQRLVEIAKRKHPCRDFDELERKLEK